MGIPTPSSSNLPSNRRERRVIVKSKVRAEDVRYALVRNDDGTFWAFCWDPVTGSKSDCMDFGAHVRGTDMIEVMVCNMEAKGYVEVERPLIEVCDEEYVDPVIPGFDELTLF